MNCNSASSMTVPILPALYMLAVGYRFHPTDEELIINYLKPKIRCPSEEVLVIGEINICEYEPCDLPDLCKIKSDDQVWYFFCPCNFKYQNSRRLNRTTKKGYWKPTGKPITIKAKRTKKKIGTKKTLVFYKGRGRGVRTGWIMHEYVYLEDSNLPNQGGFVLCKLKKKPEKIHKGEPNNQVAWSSNFDSGESSQNMAHSAGGTSESSNHAISGFDVLVSASSNASGLSDFENENTSEICQLSAPQFASEGNWRASMAIPSNLENPSTYDKGESSSQVASDFGTQNLVQEPDISIVDESESSAFISTPLENHKETDMSNQSFWWRLLAISEEENPQSAAPSFNLEALLRKSNSAPLQPMCSD